MQKALKLTTIKDEYLNLIHWTLCLTLITRHTMAPSEPIFQLDCRCCNKIYDTIQLHRKCTTVCRLEK